MTKSNTDKNNNENSDDPTVVETGVLRNNLSDILSSVKYHQYARIKVKRHNKVQASIIPNDDAELFYDLTVEDLNEIKSAITEYIQDRSKKGKGKGKVVNLGDILKKQA